jgi:hypothetical protein
MITSIFSKQDLLKTFLPLSDAGKNFLEILLVNPKSSKVEGRGFFNDSDFLLEACKPLVGRYNFCLTNFGFSQDKIPTRESFNQFDRTLLDPAIQDQSRVHSLSIAILFKPELIREMNNQTGNTDHFMAIIYQIDAISSRLNLKSYSIDYFLTGVVLRFWPVNALRQRPLNKAALVLVSKHLVDLFEKKMNTQEQKRFAITASAMGKLWDPTPGLPGLFTGEDANIMTVTSSGSLEPSEDTQFSEILDEIFDPKKKPVRENQKSANIQGLSQSWQETQENQFETTPTRGLQLEKDFSSGKEEYLDPQARENSKELVAYFHSHSQTKWRWPLYSATFNHIHKGTACGELLLLQCDRFASELGFQFLMQCAEDFNKEGTGQILVFSKKRTLGSLAKSALSRHYKSNPFSGKTPVTPDGASLTKAYTALYPNPPQIPACNRNDSLDQLLKYLEHDYLLKQKKRGGSLMPLTIIIDNLTEFSQGDQDETFQQLSNMKMRLYEFNACLWVMQLRCQDSAKTNQDLALADFHLSLDHDGSQEAALQGKSALPLRASEWEAGFHAEFTTEMLLKEFSLLKIRFQGHGSHRSFVGHYAYQRPTGLFQEINPPPTAGQNPKAQSPGSTAPQMQKPAS